MRRPGLIAAAPHLGLRACYLTDTVSFAAALYGIARLPAMRPSGGMTRPGPRAIAEGVGFIRRSQVIAGAFLADLNATVFGLPVALFPAINAQRFGGDPRTLGLFLTAIGVGGLVSAAFSGPLGHVTRQGRAMLCTVAIWGGTFAGFAVAPACGWRSACWLRPAPRTRSPWCFAEPSSPPSPPISFAAGSWRPTMSSVRAARSSATWRPAPWDR
jgi:hypothetical protein